MRIDKYWILSFLAFAITLATGVGAYLLTYKFSEEFLLSYSTEIAISYVEVSAVAVGSRKRADRIKEILERAPYISSVELGREDGKSPYTIVKELIFPDGRLPLTIQLDRELIERKASNLSKSVATAITLLTAVFLTVYLVAIRLLYLEPLHRIRRDINRIYRGVIKKIPQRGRDEFGRIRKSINMMIDSIRERDERAEIISRFIQLLTVGRGFNEEFIELMRRVLRITETDGVIIGIRDSENGDLVDIRLITPNQIKDFKKRVNELEGIEPYILEIEREVETDKRSILSRDEKELGIEYIYGMPLTVFSEILGYVIFFRRKKEPLAEENKKFIKNVAKSIAIAVEIKQLINNLERQLKREKELFNKVLMSLIRGIEIRDSYTRGHSERVAYFSKRIAQEMGLPQEEVSKIYTAALLHDIGKIGIPDSILLKPGRLTEREYEIIKLHPILSYELLKNLDFLEGALDGIKYHHERWDGSGYPEGLKGTEIPLSARIIAVADTFDAMTSERIYRKALSKKEAIKEIRNLAGKAYDPEVVENSLHILLSEEPPEPEEEYLEDEIIREIEERRLDYFLRDPLTGVFNRNALELAYKVAKERFVELSGIVVDIVKLREINIKEGWEKGDELLKRVVTEIQRRVPNVITVRYSGDNFLIFTSRKNLEEAAGRIKEIEGELAINLRVLTVERIDNVEELKKELTELEFEGKPPADVKIL